MKVTFPDEFIKQVIEKNDIIELAGEYFDVTQAGDLYKAHCKHRGGDKTPSLTFFRDTQSFYCFGCKAGARNDKTNGSDIIAFVQWVENIEWQDAVMFLANRAGLPIPKAELSAEERQKMGLFESVMKENRRYWGNLFASDKEIKQWFNDRGIDDADIAKWRLGSHKGTPVYAIIDDYGRTVGFSYRVDRPDAKYVNTKTSPIFKKGNILYGLNYIKKDIRRHKTMVIVEGYNDVIALQKFGVPAVATMGTSITKEQIELIKKYTNYVILFLDGDIAGIDGTIENIKILKREGIEVDVVNVVGFDPDDVVAKYKEKTFEFIIKNKKLAFQFLINNVLDKYFDSMLRLKKGTMKQLEEILGYIENDDERRLYKDQLMKVISLEENSSNIKEA